MKCFKPYFRRFFGYEYALPLPCGHCLACRYNQSRDWAIRIELESLKYDIQEVTFVTLTYDRQHLPHNSSLEPSELQSFVKRLRKQGHKFRFFACGEYGDLRGRPHYHLVLFGVRAADLTSLGVLRNDWLKGVRPTPVGRGFKEAWTYGFVDVQRAATRTGLSKYVASYVAKKQKAQHYYSRFREPPFHRSSLGFGLHIIDTFKMYTPFILKDNKRIPLPRYLRNKLAEKFCVTYDVTKSNIEYLASQMAEALKLNVKVPEFEKLYTKFAVEKFHYNEYNRGRLEYQKSFIRLLDAEKTRKDL